MRHPCQDIRSSFFPWVENQIWCVRFITSTHAARSILLILLNWVVRKRRKSKILYNTRTLQQIYSARGI